MANGHQNRQATAQVQGRRIASGPWRRPWRRRLTQKLRTCYLQPSAVRPPRFLALQEIINSDEDLILAIAQGDQGALSDLYARYSAVMMAVAYKVLGNRREAEDILHDVFLEVWKKAGDYDSGRGQVRTWLLIRVRSRSLDLCKSAGRSRSVSLEDVRMAERASSDGDPSVGLDRLAVREALAALPEKQQAVLELAYFKGMSSSEIAEALSIPIGTVKSRAATALSALRDRLGQGSGGAP